jgi:hypothetical protein
MSDAFMFSATSRSGGHRYDRESITRRVPQDADATGAPDGRAPSEHTSIATPQADGCP